ncbi:hypothetical protein H6F88_26685 [Oculatella sp. FACHB-28]|uniref:hypothetical protein n=1 Tax=Oculatella sp. FACHB-28 TaxID=2692845 RepID=UPI001689B85B|nr:hypothetical protein [Oculatella sp. FACHB-28]MBD2059539.1 hypothetical protein [Oculatella sp. FACHB-28]
MTYRRLGSIFYIAFNQERNRMAIATSLHSSSDRVTLQTQITKQRHIKLLKSRWSGGRAYLPLLGIVLLLAISLVLIRLHRFGLTLFSSLKRDIR